VIVYWARKSVYKCARSTILAFEAGVQCGWEWVLFLVIECRRPGLSMSSGTKDLIGIPFTQINTSTRLLMVCYLRAVPLQSRVLVS
jgi:hypothetical protein